MSLAREYLPDEAEGRRLPPCSNEAEEAVLGCLLGPAVAGLTSAEMMRLVMERFAGEEVFYDLRRKSIYDAIVYVYGKSGTVDTIAVYDELKARALAEQVGGLDYLVALPDKVGSALNISQYVDIVWEKFVSRRLLEKNAEQSEIVRQFDGAPSESFLAQVDQQHIAWKRLLERGAGQPKCLKEVKEFGDAYYAAWFSRKEESYGWELPFKFPLRLRPSEQTLMTGDNGSGKSSMLGQMAVVVGKQLDPGQKIVIASFEVPPEVTLWIMARQLLGVGKLECTEENIRKILKAFAWLNERVLIYDFLGIGNWQEVLNAFRFARENKNGVLFIVDSVMRIGIQDDDYATQGLAASAFADFAVKSGGHVILVVHENKGEGRGKDRVRGTKQWTDNAHNVVGMKRNEQKAEKIEELRMELEAGEIDQKEYDISVEKLRGVWDSKFLLHKQRFPGSQQNGSRWLYFERHALQFHERPGLAPVNYMM